MYCITAREEGQTPLVVWSCTVSKCGRTVSKDDHNQILDRQVGTKPHTEFDQTPSRAVMQYIRAVNQGGWLARLTPGLIFSAAASVYISREHGRLRTTRHFVCIIHTNLQSCMSIIRGHIQTICSEKINVIMTLTPGPPPPLASYRIITFMKVERLQSFTLLRDSIPRPYNTITYSSVVST